jgi:hypothetical protein
MVKYVFLIDAIRIGGAERLCFDESYELLGRKIENEIVCLSGTKIIDGSILEVDKNFDYLKLVQLSFAGESRFRQLVHLVRILIHNRKNEVRIISHSTRGAVLARIAAKIMFKRIHITLFIHQLISLSKPTQALKRIFHSLFANRISTSSAQFKTDWLQYIESNLVLSILYKKQIDFNRMGVFLPRLHKTEKMDLELCSNDVAHLIFMSRITNWKGFPVFQEICNKIVDNDIHSLALTTENSRTHIFKAADFVSENSHYIKNSGVANYHFNCNAVHIYPTDYGPKVKYPQSIGMNVLECLGLGIGNLISNENFETWPELRNHPLVRVVDWGNQNHVLKELREILQMKTENKLEYSFQLSEVISIRSHIDRVMEL